MSAYHIESEEDHEHDYGTVDEEHLKQLAAKANAEDTDKKNHQKPPADAAASAKKDLNKQSTPAASAAPKQQPAKEEKKNNPPTSNAQPKNNLKAGK